MFLILYPAASSSALLRHLRVTHHLSHTNFVTRHLSHTTLSHTIFHTRLCHTLSFTHDFVTHYLSHTTLSHTLFHIPTYNFVTDHLSHTILSHTIFHTHHLCHTPSFTHIIFVTHNFPTHHLSHTSFVTHTHHLSHTTFTHTIFHTPTQAWRLATSTCVAGVALGPLLSLQGGPGRSLVPCNESRLGPPLRVFVLRSFLSAGSSALPGSACLFLVAPFAPDAVSPAWVGGAASPSHLPGGDPGKGCLDDC